MVECNLAKVDVAGPNPVSRSSLNYRGPQMKIEIKDVNPCKKILRIEVPIDVVEREFDAVYKEIGKVAEISGFRKGKAPRNLLEQYHSKTAKDEVLQKLIPSTYSEAVKKHDLYPVSYPEISQVKFVDNQPLYFEAVIDVKPDVKLKKYKGLNITKKKFEIKDEEVKKSLDLLRDRFAEYKTIDSRPVKKGDYVTADYEFEADGKTEKQEKAWFLINETEGGPKEIIEKLIGRKVGDIVEGTLNLPKEYPKAEFAGKKAVFKVSVKEIKEKSLPELDEEFIKGLGNYDSLDKLKEAIRDDIKVRKENEIEMDVDRQTAEELLKHNPIDVPLSLIKKEAEQIFENVKARLKHQGLKEEVIAAKEGDLKKNAEADAEKQVKIYFLLDKIAEVENINCGDDDLESAYERIAGQNKTDKEKVKSYIAEKGSLERLKDEIRHKKTVDYIVNEARR